MPITMFCAVLCVNVGIECVLASFFNLIVCVVHLCENANETNECGKKETRL